MNHFIFNLADGDRAQATSRLRARMWALERDERHCSALAAGDLALVHIGRPSCQFIGRVALATAFREGTPQESATGPDGHSGGVLLADVEEWPRAVPLAAAVQRIDPTASNPYVQSNAAGFRSGIVLITAEEYAAVVALSREAGQA
jgi:hypothetical protein